MKKVILSLSLIGILLVTSGCFDEMLGEKISVQKRMGEENIFEDFNEINQKALVKKAIEIVGNAKWEKEIVEMARYADYQFQFLFKDRNGSENKMASYSLWVSQNGESLEIIKDDDRYVKLTKPDSANLYEILTGGE